MHFGCCVCVCGGGQINTLCCGPCAWMCAVFINACMFLYVKPKIKRGQKIKKKPQKIINWVPFVLPLHMMSYTAESETSLL